jgi:RNA polymerase sigma factor (sigma-70 family)
LSNTALLDCSLADPETRADPGHPPSVEHARAGSPAGWVEIDREALYAELQPLVRRLIRQYGETAELRQDLAGEIYCRFVALVEAYDPARGIPLRPYLVRTLTASVYTWARSQWRNRQREMVLDGEATSSEAVAVVDPTSQWDRNLMTGEVLQLLPGAIRKLPARQRQVVVWRYYEARSFEEIAETLKIRPATARSLLRHGVTNLRRSLLDAGVVWE